VILRFGVKSFSRRKVKKKEKKMRYYGLVLNKSQKAKLENNKMRY
jgi:hypothetical protein